MTAKINMTKLKCYNMHAMPIPNNPTMHCSINFVFLFLR